MIGKMSPAQGAEFRLMHLQFDNSRRCDN